MDDSGIGAYSCAMNFLNIILAALSAAAGYFSLQLLDAPKSHMMAAAFGSLACYALTLPGEACGQAGRFGRPQYRMSADGHSGIDLRFVGGGCHAT